MAFAYKRHQPGCPALQKVTPKPSCRCNGLWTARWELGRDARQRRQFDTKGGFKTKKAANTFAEQQEADLRGGTYVTPVRLTLAEWWDLWFRDIAPQTIRMSTLYPYGLKFDRHVRGEIGNVPLQQVGPEHIRQVLTVMFKKGLAASTRRQVLASLSSAFKAAMVDQKVHRNPVGLVAAPPVDEPHPVALTDEELRRFLQEAARSDYWAPLALFVFSGLRRSEICGLQWRDIDLRAGTLIVNRGAVMVPKHGVVIERPKSARGHRRIVLSGEIVSILREHQPANALPGDWVFASPNGGPLRSNTITAWAKRVFVAAGIPEGKLKTLRSSHATHLLEVGFSTREVADRLGHDPAVLQRSYWGKVTNREQEAADAFSKVVGYVSVTSTGEPAAS